MVRNSALGFLATILIVYQVRALELLANYKHWKSMSNLIIYDYSGNSRHGSYNNKFIFTDRGVAPDNLYYTNLMSYAFPTNTEYTISFWLLNYLETCYFFFNIHHNLRLVQLSYVTSNTNLFTLSFVNNGTPQPSKSISSFQGWNFHTVTISIDSLVLSGVNIELYINLVYIDSSSIDTGVVNINIYTIHMGNYDPSPNTGLILYEMWVHIGLSNISELSSLFSSSSSCGCTYNCPTSPSNVCLSNSGKYQNQAGQACPTSCTSNFQSCDASLNCIPKSKGVCKYGIYDIASSECLFFCPNNSCNCSTVTDSTTSIQTFRCSCASGYKSISSDPPACISIGCLTYHKVGYNYICDTTEPGYTLDSSGNCCICDPTYTQVSSSPIVCMNIPYCLTYVRYGVNYICSSCATGYRVDSEGNCNLCNTNYVVVQKSPFTCALKILNCINYIQVGTSWKCQICIQGYKVDTNLECNECDVGYALSSTTPFTCDLGILNCINHIKVGTSWKCQLCTEGYKVDKNLECNLCDTNYALVQNSPFTCAKFVLGCTEYMQDDVKWMCKSCSKGFNLSDSGLKCITSNCISYIFQEDIYICSECSVGYNISAEGICDSCEVGYEMVSDNPVLCQPKIQNCSTYKKLGEEFLCEKCSIGYKLSSTGICDECDTGYSIVDFESGLCKPDIINCLEYDMSTENLKCTRCKEGYTIDPSNNCNQCDIGYTKLPQENSICIEEIYHCSKYGINLNSWICIECALGYELDDKMKCGICSEGYNHSNDYAECILISESNPQSSDIEENETDDENKETISIEQKQRGELVESSNSVSSTITAASTSISSMASMDPNTLILYINTIQLLSLIQYLNINIPYEIKKQQSSNSKFMQNINILSYIKIDDLQSWIDDENSFISQVIYQIITLGLILTINYIIYLASRYGKGKLKQLANNSLRHFKYTFYLQFYMITYLNLVYSASAKLFHVRNI